MKKITILIILPFLFLSGCNPVVENNQGKTTKSQSASSCEIDTDCELPADYAIRSNCPYSTACKDETCWVVCPMWEHQTIDQGFVSYDVECQSDHQCDCSGWDSQGQFECNCHNKQCSAFIEMIN